MPHNLFNSTGNNLLYLIKVISDHKSLQFKLKLHKCILVLRAKWILVVPKFHFALKAKFFLSTNRGKLLLTINTGWGELRGDD